MNVERHRGSAAAFHALPFPEPLTAPTVWVFDVDHPALVLGSAQPDAVVDRDAAARAGVEVVRRRSGGGAVLLESGASLWIDVLLPHADPRWSDDVGRATYWLGEAWAAALATVGLAGEVHRGGLERAPWGSLVCFAAVGPGEVTVSGRKVVGVSQRRTRAGARFQCVVLARWDPDPLLWLLRLPDEERLAARVALAERATGVGAHLPALEAAFLVDTAGMG